MNELTIDVGGNNRGFQTTMEDSSKKAKSFAQSLPEIWKTVQGNPFAFLSKSSQELINSGAEHLGVVGRLKEGFSDLRQHVSGMVGQFAAGFISEEAIRKTVELGEQVNNLSKQTGTSTDTVQKWGYALKESGSNMEALRPFFTKLAVARDAVLKGTAGSGGAAAAFRELGVTVQDLKSKRLEDIGMMIANTFKDGDAQKLIGSLREVGGKGAGAMVAAFKNGMQELGDEAVAMGVIIDKATIGKLAEGAEKFKQIGGQLMAGFAPVISLLLTGFEKVYNVVGRISAAAGGFSVGGLHGAGVAINAFNKDIQNKEAATAKRIKNGPGGADSDSIQDDISNTKALTRAQREYRNELESQSPPEERRSLLTDDAHELKLAIEKAEAVHDEVAALNLKTQAMKVNKEIGDITKKMYDDAHKEKKPEATPRRSVHVDSLAAMGGIGSLGALYSNPMLEVSKRMEHHLSNIAHNTAHHGQDPHAK